MHQVNTTVDFTQINQMIRLAMIVAVAFLAIWILRRLNRRFFAELMKDQKNLYLSFAAKLVEVVIFIVVTVLAVSAISGARTVWQTVLGGTAVISAVVAFAAQDVIKDVLAGMMISIFRPFDIGDRIEMEDGTAGIVEDITMRHVVLRGIDTVRIVVPNSRLNAMQVTNYSYHTALRAISFRFSISYDSDVETAKMLIDKAVRESELTVPGKPEADRTVDYAPVYFLTFADSALVMAVTVYYKEGTATEAVRDDINSRVMAAFTAAGIEIPYNYVTVVTK